MTGDCTERSSHLVLAVRRDRLQRHAVEDVPLADDQAVQPGGLEDGARDEGAGDDDARSGRVEAGHAAPLLYRHGAELRGDRLGPPPGEACLLYTSDAADDLLC